MFWSKFTSAADDLRLFRDTQKARAAHTGDPLHVFLRELAETALQAVVSGQRFYLPDASDLLENKHAIDEIIPVVRLPYDTICILHEVPFTSVEGEVSSRWAISIAFDMQAPTVQQALRVQPPDFPFKVHGGFALVSLLHSEDGWVLAPCAVGYSCALNVDAAPKDWKVPAGMFAGQKHIGHISIAATGFQQIDANVEQWARELDADHRAVWTLCALLAVSGTKTSQVAPPDKVNAKRASNSRTQLFSYHVLDVGGELWDAREAANSGGNRKVRSHLRRGHIRKLNSGVFTWVRSCVVKGGTVGFVAKDYAVVK